MNYNKTLELENRITENSESSPFKSRRRLVNRQNTETSFYLKNLHKNLQYIESIGANQETRRGLKIKKRHEYVNKFIKNLRSKQNNYHELTQYHFSLIDDPSIYDRRNESLAERAINNIVCFQKVFDFLSVILKKVPLFYPEAQAKTFWDLIAFISRLYFLFFIPLDLAWVDQEFVFVLYWRVTITMLVLLITDQIVEFNTAYYECGQIVNSRLKIFKNSISRKYGTEWIATIIIIVYAILSQRDHIKIDPNQNIIHLSLMLFLSHFGRIRSMVKHYEESLNVNKKISSMLQLGKFIVFLFYFLHLFSSYWFWVGSYSMRKGENNWVEKAGIYDHEWNIQYLESLYFSAVTMFTVGYGDISPISNLEKASAILYIMITSIQLPYSINTVGKFIEDITAYGEETMRKLSLINTYMEKRKISFNLQMEIRQYLNYYWEKQNQQENEDQNQIISQLSECLKERLMAEAYQIMLNQCPLFKNRFSIQLKQQLVKKVKSVIFPPETYIDTDQIYLYFIDEGEVEIHLEVHPQYPIGRQSKGQTLGINSFITGKAAPERFKCLTFTKIMLLSRKDFMKCLQESPQDFEIFCQMKDYLTFNPGCQLYPINCFSCSSAQHKLIECPLVHYVPDKEQIIKRHIASKPQDRTVNRRRTKYRELPGLANLSELNRAAWRIQSQQFDKAKIYSDNDEIRRQIRKSRSVSFYNEKDMITHYQNKFISIVKKIICINRLRMLPKSNSKKNQLQNQLMMQMLLERMKITKKNHILFDKEIHQIQGVIDQLQQKSSFEGFETSHEYKFYNSGSNISQIAPTPTKLKIGLITKFMPYFLYPGEIIKRFGCKPSIRNIVNYRRRKNVILI